MTDNDIKIICEKIDSLHTKILKSKFAECVTESEMLSLILAVEELNRQKAEIERLKEKAVEDEKLLNDRVIESVNAVSKAHLKYENALEEQIKTTKAEAIKEFATRLLDEYDIWTEYDATEYGYVDGLVNNLVKKMTGEKLQ